MKSRPRAPAGRARGELGRAGLGRLSRGCLLCRHALELGLASRARASCGLALVDTGRGTRATAMPSRGLCLTRPAPATSSRLTCRQGNPMNVRQVVRPAAVPSISRPTPSVAFAAVARGGPRPPATPRPVERPASLDAETVVYRLEEAGRTLLSLPRSGYTTALRTTTLDIVRSAADCLTERGRDAAPIRPAYPSSAQIDRMDEAYGWIPLIPRDKLVLRRIVGARSLGEPGDGAPSLRLAQARHRCRRGPQGGAALARPGDRRDRPRAPLDLVPARRPAAASRRSRERDPRVHGACSVALSGAVQ